MWCWCKKDISWMLWTFRCWITISNRSYTNYTNLVYNFLFFSFILFIYIFLMLKFKVCLKITKKFKKLVSPQVHKDWRFKFFPAFFRIFHRHSSFGLYLFFSISFFKISGNLIIIFYRQSVLRQFSGHIYLEDTIQYFRYALNSCSLFLFIFLFLQNAVSNPIHYHVGLHQNKFLLSALHPYKNFFSFEICGISQYF